MSILTLLETTLRTSFCVVETAYLNKSASPLLVPNAKPWSDFLPKAKEGALGQSEVLWLCFKHVEQTSYVFRQSRDYKELSSTLTNQGS